MKYYNNIKGVVFDLDGTLYKMQWFMKPLLTISLFPRSLRLPLMMKIRKELAGKKFSGYEELINKIASEIADKENRDDADKISFWIKNDFYTAFIRVLRLHRDTRKGVVECLERLSYSGIRTGVLSDFARIDERLDSLSIDKNMFDLILSSENEGALKPNPEPFMKFSRTWNIEPENILFIGDRDDTDGAGARACGMEFMNVKSTKNWNHCIRIISESIQ